MTICRGEFTRAVCEWRDRERTLTLRVDPQGRPAIGRRMQVSLAGSARTMAITLARSPTVVKL